MFAVLLTEGNDLPEVYVFNDKATAKRFASWVAQFDGDAVVVPVSTAPQGWGDPAKALTKAFIGAIDMDRAIDALMGEKESAK